MRNKWYPFFYCLALLCIFCPKVFGANEHEWIADPLPEMPSSQREIIDQILRTVLQSSRVYVHRPFEFDVPAQDRSIEFWIFQASESEVERLAQRFREVTKLLDTLSRHGN